MVKINRDLCIGCGECAADCPVNVLHIIEGKADVSGPCFQCGHCVAVCPVRAAAIPEYDMDDVEDYVPKTFDVNPENMLHAIKFRRSIRNFRPEKIEREKVEDILNAGRYTATARNKQACTFIFIQDQLEEFKTLVWKNMPDIIRTLQKDVPRYAGIFERFYEKWKADSTDDNFFYNTPAFLVISADNHPLDGGLSCRQHREHGRCPWSGRPLQRLHDARNQHKPDSEKMAWNRRKRNSRLHAFGVSRSYIQKNRTKARRTYHNKITHRIQKNGRNYSFI